MARLAVTAKTPTSAPGSSRRSGSGGIARRPAGAPRSTGFTLVELLVVLLLIALLSGLAGLALRDSGQARLERDALRLAALLEAGRAEARASGVAVRFELALPGNGPLGNGPLGNGQPGNATADTEPAYRFVGLPPEALPPGRWLDGALRARIDGARALRLGPEPMIGAQRIVLSLGEHQLVLATDGLAPFAVETAVEAVAR